MRSLTVAIALAGLVAVSALAQERLETFQTTDSELLSTVSTNEAALDSQMFARSIEVRGIARRIVRSETGGYLLQFAPENQSDNFVRLQVDCEFGSQQRDALGSLKLPAAVIIRGAVSYSNWEPRYDNHRYYRMVIRDSQIMQTAPLLR